MTGARSGRSALVERADIDWSPSTVRAELASLEDEGFLTHPHTSAGRVPTDTGYRFYVEQLLERQDRLPRPTLGGPRTLTHAPRGRRRDPRHDHRALPDHRPGGPRHRAAAAHGDDPPDRGPAPAAAGGDGRRDRLERRRHEARLHLRARGRPGAGRVGRELPERATRRPRPRSADGRGPAARPGAGRPGEGLPGGDLGAPSPTSRSRPRTRSTSTGRPGCSPRSTSPTCRTPTI